ncbi:hypothetical protein IWQ61_006041 [Dispira simplex]|nr:hypothetical protein IWQ61_006041 [Dispira simplex]
MAVSHGEIAFINELAEQPQTWLGKTVRVVGTLRDYDVATDTARLEHQGQLTVDTRLLGDFSYPIGSTLLVIGDMDQSSSTSDEGPEGTVSVPLTLRARIARAMDGLDMGLYRSTVDIKRKFEAQW